MAWDGAGNDHPDWQWLLLAPSARAGWLGVKHQFTYLLTCSVCRPREQVQQGARLGAHVPPDQRGTLQGAVGHEDAVPWRLRQAVPAHPQGAVHGGSPVRVISLVEYLGRDVGWAQRPKSGSTPSPPSQRFFLLIFFGGGGGGGGLLSRGMEIMVIWKNCSAEELRLVFFWELLGIGNV